MQALNAVRRDAAGAWKPTVAGLLLFGKSVALRRCFPMTRVDYIRVPGREWVPHPDRRFDTVELRAPLFTLLRRTQAAVLDDLPKGFGLEEGQLQRSDKPVIPLRALREALVNALMHRSYRVHAPVQVIRYANRLEIRNPGFSLKSPDHLGEPGSMPRNPHIAAVLHETRFAETKGSGIRAMREAMDQIFCFAPSMRPVIELVVSRTKTTSRTGRCSPCSYASASWWRPTPSRRARPISSGAPWSGSVRRSRPTRRASRPRRRAPR